MRLRIFALLLLCLLGNFGCKKQDPEVRYSELMGKAKTFQDAQKWDEARLTLMSAVEAKPDRVEGYYQLAEVLVRLKNFGRARELYQSAINIDPKHKEARLHLAAFLLAANQLEEAEAHLQKLIEFFPDDVEVQILNASILNARKNYPAARKILEQLIAKDNENFGAVSALGDLALAEGKTVEAEEQFKKALKLKPNSQPIRLALADIMMREGRMDEAQTFLEKLVETEPSNTNLRYFLGEFMLFRGMNEKAIEQFQEMIKTDPLRHDARDRVYDFLVLKRDLDGARALTKEIEKTEKEEPGIYYFQARDLELEGKQEPALALYLKAIEGLPSYAPAFRRAGVIELQLGKVNEGLEHLNQAVEINSNEVGARLALARHYFATKEFGQAKDQLTKILSVFPRQLGANIMRADIALIEGDLAGAERVYQGLVNALPENPAGYFKLAVLREQQKQYPAAIELYRKVLEFDREVMIAATRYTELLANQNGFDKTIADITSLRDKSKNQKGEYELLLASMILKRGGPKSETIPSARAHIQAALEHAPTLIQAYFTLAQLDSAEGNLEGAIKNYQTLVEKNPRNIAARMLLAVGLESKGATTEAAAQYREILALNPRFGPAANNLAWLLADKMEGDLDEALRLAQIGKEEIPSMSNSTDTLGWVYLKRNSARAAVPYFTEAIEQEIKSNPPRKDGKRSVNPEILYHLALALEKIEDRAGAKKALEEAISLGVEQLPIQKEVALLKQRLL